MANENYVMHDDVKKEITELKRDISQIKTMLADIQKTLRNNAARTQKSEDTRIKK